MLTRQGFLTAIALAVFPLLPSSGICAEPLAVPTEEIVLEVSGNIGNANAGTVAQFDLQMLRGMRQVSYETTTLWTEGVTRFTGVPLKEILRLLNVTDGVLRARAINEYAVDIPVETIEPNVPLLAFEMNGQTMSRRDKGPLWIVYPYDSDEAYRSETVYTRSIWQLDRIEVTD
ncbi:molybdopterin-dependent oxidoreductase [Ruegeria marina]|uniref:Oxidoreductase molybdopterin-binding domain-containing protein n=1 Tax=Ruegeria marina TaxID=639004 RepID=A0A1G6SJ48_9RHOB|nr:molybdopterin-dependent oxidoreductase [Ruegeria marina]SDD16932.1 hypothetical protein SAMN04488239_105297 [Ruegeria marina]